MKLTKSQLKEIIREEILKEGKINTKPKNIKELIKIISQWENNAKVIDSNLQYDTDAGMGWMDDFKHEFKALKSYLKSLKKELPIKQKK